MAGVTSRKAIGTMPPMSDPTDNYLALREAVDRRIAELMDLHAGQLACHPRCCDCCVDFTVFPVEYAAILAQLEAAGVRLRLDEAATCVFLQDGLCSLYEARPIICRTHGLPIAYLDDASGAMTVSFCPKNFRQADPDDLDFGPENTLDLEWLNGELFAINLAYIAACRPDLTPTSRVPLRQLAEDLNPGQPH